MGCTIHSAAIDISVDTSFEYNRSYDDQKEVGMQMLISHKESEIEFFS